MKVHTTAFKEQIKEMGRELDSIITYGETVLGVEELNAVTPLFQGAILKSVMKQLDIDSNILIPPGTLLNYKFGVKVNGEYEYLDFGNYIVKDIEKQEDTNSYKMTCYDMMLLSMKDYVKMPITYPITIRNYINAICNYLGLTFKNRNSTFANYNREISEERYLDENGDSIGYTFRDVLDELAQVTASTICINEVDDELEIRYITNTNDTIDEEYLKDVNVNFGEKYGPVNTIVLSRSSDTDNIYYPDPLPQNPFELKISDNQIMNFEDRSDYLPDIYNKLNGLEYYINDFRSTGICYYDLCDRYNVAIAQNIYSCVMLNDEVDITQGLQENVYTEMPEETVTEYKYESETDKAIRDASIILNKKIGQVDIRGKTINLDADNISITSPNFSVTSDGEIISKKGTIGGYEIGENELYAETFAPHDYTENDLTILADLTTSGSWTQEQLEYYDLNNDGTLNIIDVLILDNLLQNGITTTNAYKITMQTGLPSTLNAYKIEDSQGNEILNINASGFQYKGRNILEQKILWEGQYYMNEVQSIDLSETPMSAQPNGIVLVFSAYTNGEPQNYNWCSFFIPKKFPELHNGGGMLFPMFTTAFGTAGNKYIYIYKDKIKGHADNTKSGTGASGIKYSNASWVLRYVIGV